MKSLLLAGAACIVLAGSASAADLANKSYPVKAPIVAAPVFSWTGFYLGANVGYGWGDADTSFEGIDTGSYSNDGVFGGGQVGYNFQFDNNIVLGVEADIQFGDLKDSTSGTLLGVYPYSASIKTDYFGTVRGRIGYALDNFLPYFTGGFAYGKTKARVNFDGDVFSDSTTATGWTVGGGLEYGITNNWTVKAEYLYVDLGSNDFSDAGYSAKVDQTFQTVKLGVNYKF